MGKTYTRAMYTRRLGSTAPKTRVRVSRQSDDRAATEPRPRVSADDSAGLQYYQLLSRKAQRGIFKRGTITALPLISDDFYNFICICHRRVSLSRSPCLFNSASEIHEELLPL